ncbi:MAG: hypothetical protein LUC44_01915, partial [Prevotellaceae bacterium]|nr:hypothetical protein [Prevotellaceae bacterium]
MKMRTKRIAASALCLLMALGASAQYVGNASDIWLKRMPGMEKKDRKAPVWVTREKDGTAFNEVTNPTLESYM